MEELFIQYAPIIIVVCMFLFKNKIFVTPAQLAKTKEEILEKVKEDYATKELVQFIREDISEIKQQLATMNQYLRDLSINNK